MNELQQSVSQKRQVPQNKFPVANAEQDGQQQDRPFPNRFSSGEYENVQQQQNQQQQSKLSSVPPLPKRNNETHLMTWDRT